MTVRPRPGQHRRPTDNRTPNRPAHRAVVTIPAAEVDDHGRPVVHLPEPGAAAPRLEPVTVSRREHEIIAGFACGQSNDEIAAALGLSPPRSSRTRSGSSGSWGPATGRTRWPRPSGSGCCPTARTRCSPTAPLAPRSAPR